MFEQPLTNGSVSVHPVDSAENYKQTSPGILRIPDPNNNSIIRFRVDLASSSRNTAPMNPIRHVAEILARV